jgi:group I intron endonuclease
MRRATHAVLGNCGIYRVENLLTGDCYYGQSHYLDSRPDNHIKLLAAGKHSNKHLQNAYNKYGGEYFVATIVLYCEDFELVRYEQACVDHMQSTYNQCRVCVTSTKGLKPSEEAIRKNVEAHIGVAKSEETKHKMSEYHKGKPSPNKGHIASEKTLAKMSKAHKGRPSEKKGTTLPDDTKLKMSKSHMGNTNGVGHVHTDEQKRKISAKLVGNQHLKGHIHTEESKHKMSESQKKRQAKLRAEKDKKVQ